MDADIRGRPSARRPRSYAGRSFISAVSVQWLLFDFGERTAVLNAAKQVSAIANITFTAAHQQVVYKVSYSYAAARYAHGIGAGSRSRRRVRPPRKRNSRKCERRAKAKTPTVL